MPTFNIVPSDQESIVDTLNHVFDMKHIMQAVLDNYIVPTTSVLHDLDEIEVSVKYTISIQLSIDPLPKEENSAPGNVR